VVWSSVHVRMHEHAFYEGVLSRYRPLDVGDWCWKRICVCSTTIPALVEVLPSMST